MERGSAEEPPLDAVDPPWIRFSAGHAEERGGGPERERGGGVRSATGGALEDRYTARGPPPRKRAARRSSSSRGNPDAWLFFVHVSVHGAPRAQPSALRAF